MFGTVASVGSVWRRLARWIDHRIRELRIRPIRVKRCRVRFARNSGRNACGTVAGTSMTTGDREDFLNSVRKLSRPEIAQASLTRCLLAASLS
jgi:hypothetical protein